MTPRDILERFLRNNPGSLLRIVVPTVDAHGLRWLQDHTTAHHVRLYATFIEDLSVGAAADRVGAEQFLGRSDVEIRTAAPAAAAMKAAVWVADAGGVSTHTDVIVGYVELTKDGLDRGGVLAAVDAAERSRLGSDVASVHAAGSDAKLGALRQLAAASKPERDVRGAQPATPAAGSSSDRFETFKPPKRVQRERAPLPAHKPDQPKPLRDVGIWAVSAVVVAAAVWIGVWTWREIPKNPPPEIIAAAEAVIAEPPPAPCAYLTVDEYPACPMLISLAGVPYPHCEIIPIEHRPLRRVSAANPGNYRSANLVTDLVCAWDGPGPYTAGSGIPAGDLRSLNPSLAPDGACTFTIRSPDGAVESTERDLEARRDVGTLIHLQPGDILDTSGCGWVPADTVEAPLGP